jgi:5-deoxy-5-amino-3-dehydroquinate synthase
VLAERTAGGDHRPLLGHDPAGTLARLAAERAPLYREVADLVIDVDDLPADGVVDHLTPLLRAVRSRCARGERKSGEGGRWISVPVTLGERTYPVVVGPGVRHALGALLPAGTRRVAVVTQAELPVEVDPGVEHRVFLMGTGEPAKSLATIEALCRDFARWGLTRADTVVAVGGGLVTDTAGFAAAVYHRGVAVVHVATTLLAQVDAAIGGKTGVNLPEGKNLVGAFWQPSAVLCDTETLASLPERELRSGLGEVAKYHFLGAPDLDRLPIDERVAACVRIKAAVVAADEREGGRRAVLNYGHTLGHALETAGRYDLRHGEAVAVGLVYAAELARLLGRIDDDRVAEHRRVVAAYGLPDRLPAGSDTGELVTLMGRDKKAVDGLTFVLDGPDGVEPVRDVPLDAVEAALARVR